MKIEAIYPSAFYPSIKRLQGALKERGVSLLLRRPAGYRSMSAFKYPIPILNWGSGTNSVLQRRADQAMWRDFLQGNTACNFRLFNHPTSVDIASSKSRTWGVISKVEGINTPPFVTFIAGRIPGNVYETMRQIRDSRKPDDIYLLRRDGSRGGQGIVVLRSDAEWSCHLPRATTSYDYTYPLMFLVKYIKKSAEWRVHASPSKIISVSEKRRALDAEQTPDQKLIRSHENGWVFCRSDVSLPPEAADMAMKTIASLDLDFGAVDLIQGKDDKFYILEVNTAPGLEGQTLSDYATFFTQAVSNSVPLNPDHRLLT